MKSSLEGFTTKIDGETLTVQPVIKDLFLHYELKYMDQTITIPHPELNDLIYKLRSTIDRIVKEHSQ